MKHVLHLQEAVPIPESELPLLLPAQAAFHPTGRPDPPLAKVTDWVNTTDPATGEPPCPLQGAPVAAVPAKSLCLVQPHVLAACQQCTYAYINARNKL